MLFPLGFRVRDMKADNSLPVVGQSFKELCNLPTSFTLSWNSRLKLDAGWTLAAQFESFSEAKVKQLQRGVFSQCHFEKRSVQGNVLREPTALLPGCFHKSWLAGEAAGQRGNNLCGCFLLQWGIFLQDVMLCLGLVSVFLTVFPSCPATCGAVSAPAESQRSNQRGGKSGWQFLTHSKWVLWVMGCKNQELGRNWSSSSTGKPGHTVQEGEVFCLVSAAGGCARPAQSPACLDYPFYSGLKTACKFFYHSFPDCVECIVAFPGLFPHLFSKLITFMLLGSLKALCLFPWREFIFLSFELMQQLRQKMIYFRKITIYQFFLHISCSVSWANNTKTVI